MKKCNPCMWDFWLWFGLMTVLALFWGAIAAVSFTFVTWLLK